MDPHDERMAKRLAELRAREAELDREAELARDERERNATDPAAVVDRRPSNALRSALFLIGIILLAAVLLGGSVTLIGLAGRDFGDAQRTGRAAVTACTEHGPLTNHGFGYWDRCTATIAWDDGSTDTVTSDGVFTPADIGTQVRVGDLGKYRTSTKLAREDTPRRPWLAWAGYAVGLLGLAPGLLAVLILRELLRFRRR